MFFLDDTIVQSIFKIILFQLEITNHFVTLIEIQPNYGIGIIPL